MARNANATRKDLVFPVAGHFMLVPYTAAGVPNFNKAYSSAHGIVQTISRDNALNTLDLADGNSPYPAATYVQTQSGTVTYTLGTYDPELEAFVAGADWSNGDAADTEMWTIYPLTIDSVNKGVTFGEGSAKPISAEKMVVRDGFGNIFELAEGADSLTTGQFYYDSSTGKLTFAAADVNVTVYVLYAYNGTGVSSVAYKENPKITAFMAIIIGSTKDKDEASEQKVNVIVDRCSVSGSITPPTSSNDPTQGWTLTTNILKPRAGRSPITVKFEPVAEE